MLNDGQREDLAAQDALPLVGVPTLVLVHALDRDTSDSELSIGHSRYNDDHGGPWHWREDLLTGPEPQEHSRTVPGAPGPAHDAPDVAVRLRPAAEAEGAN